MPDRAAAVAHGKDVPVASTTNVDTAAKATSASDEKSTENPESKSRITMQNTYRLESKAPFDRDRVGVVIKQIMQEMLASAQYEPATSCKLAEQVCAEIQASVKEMNFDRYKLIVMVSIYEKMFQGISSRCNALWDNERDDCVSCTFSNSSMIAVGAVFGIYYE